MLLFFVTFFLLYGGMHLYVFLRARTAFAFGTTAGIFLALFMLTMTFAPFIIRMSEKQGFELFARIMSYTGYFWMGMLLLAFALLVTMDVLRIFVYAGEFILKSNLSFLKPSAQFSFFMASALAIFISVYGYFEAKNIKTEKLTIKTLKLPEEIRRLKIVQISDVHIGLIVREERLKNIVNEVKKINPDMLVSTGDLVDGQINNLAGVPELFLEINPPYGKYAVTGNHEFYAGLSQALDFTEKAGFKILRGNGLTIKDAINIVGVDDPAGENYGLFKKVSEKELLSEFSNGKITIFLKHRPLVSEETAGLFDLQLSGHTHKGQIFPFSLITKLYYPIQAGYIKLRNNSYLYVSRGSGTWGPPIRFLSPPEVTVIEFVHEKDF